MISDPNIIRLIDEGQDPKILSRVYERISKVKAPNEKIEYMAIQKKPALNLFPDSVVLTAQRIYLCEFTNLGRNIHSDVFDWELIMDIQIEENGGFATVKVVPDTEIDYIVEYIPVFQARKLLSLSDRFRSVQDNTPTAPEIIQPEIIQPETTGPAVEQQDPVLKQDDDIALPDPVLEVDWDFGSQIEPSAETTDLDAKIMKIRILFEKQRITKSEFDQKMCEYRQES